MPPLLCRLRPPEHEVRDVSDYRGKPLVIRRDSTVVYGGVEIGSVYGDPSDHTINHDWCYEHVSGTTEDGLRPAGSRHVRQGAFTKRQAAEFLAALHQEILARRVPQ
jgi:hypothetical protein